MLSLWVYQQQITYKLFATLVNLLTVTNPIMAKEKLSYFYDTFCVLHLNIVSKLQTISHVFIVLSTLFSAL